MVKLKGLGKGLDALLSSASVPINNIVEDSNIKLSELNLSFIIPGKYQPRVVFNQEELQELSDSIKQNGVIQPIVVRKIGQNRYELIAGERRWRASKLAGLEKIPAVIRKLTDEEVLAIALIENIQRKDLNIIEEANGYRRLIDEFKLTHEYLAKITGKSRSHITNILRLLNLAKDVQDLLIEGKLSMGHARALLPLQQDIQLEVANKIINDNMTTGEVEKYVSLINKESQLSTVKIKTKPVEPNVLRLETDLSDKLGMLVSIKHGKNGNGKITINYASLDELDNLLAYIK